MEELDPRSRLLPVYEQLLGHFHTFLAYLPLIVVAILVVSIFVALGRRVSRFSKPFRRLEHNPFLVDLARQAVRAAFLLVGVLIALEILDATALVGAVLGTAGVIGIVVGFAFRDLVENYIASILLSLRQPFTANDFVDIDGRQGKVIRLTSRATVLMTLDGNHLRIPNAQVFKGVILNFSRNPERRFDFGVGVGVQEDLVAAQRLGIEKLLELPGVLAEPAPMVLIEELGDSNVLIRFYAWVDQREANFGKVRSEAIRQVKSALEGAGMDLPEPIYRVQLSRPSRGERASAAPSSAEPSRADITAGDSIDAQIAAERAASHEKDLLDPAAPLE